MVVLAGADGRLGASGNLAESHEQADAADMIFPDSECVYEIDAEAFMGDIRYTILSRGDAIARPVYEAPRPLPEASIRAYHAHRAKLEQTLVEAARTVTAHVTNKAEEL